MQGKLSPCEQALSRINVMYPSITISTPISTISVPENKKSHPLHNDKIPNFVLASVLLPSSQYMCRGPLDVNDRKKERPKESEKERKQYSRAHLQHLWAHLQHAVWHFCNTMAQLQHLRHICNLKGTFATGHFCNLGHNRNICGTFATSAALLQHLRHFCNTCFSTRPCNFKSPPPHNDRIVRFHVVWFSAN